MVTTKKGIRVRIVLADHQHLVRHGLRCYLEQSKQYDVVGETADSATLPALLARLKPDVVLVDFELTPLNGPDVARVIRERFPRTAVVVLSRYENETHAVQSLRNGASAYVTKAAQPRELWRAIKTASNGGHYVSSPLAYRPMSYWLHRAERGAVDSYDALGTREREVLHLVSQGLSSTGIGRRLGISARTVETHRERVKEKLGIRNLAGLVRYAVERQLFGLAGRRRGS